MKASLSLKFKFMNLLIMGAVLPICAYLVFCGMVLFKFQVDSVFDNFVGNSQSLAYAFETSFQRGLHKLWNLNIANQHENYVAYTSNNLFQTEDNIVQLSIYKENPEHQYPRFRTLFRQERVGYLKNHSIIQGSFFHLDISTAIPPDLQLKGGHRIRKVFHQSGVPLFNVLIVRKEKQTNETFIIWAHIQPDAGIIDLLTGKDKASGFVLDSEGNIVSLSQDDRVSPDSIALAKDLHPEISNGKEIEGVLEFESADKNKLYLYYSRIKDAGLVFITAGPKYLGFNLFYTMSAGAGAFALGLFGFLFFSFFVFSKKITEAVQRLIEGTRKLGFGDFNVKVENTGKDEISVLTKTFNSSVEKLNKLFHAKESDADLVKLWNMQKTLFPNVDLVTDAYEISSLYSPSETCGGDWWTYFTRKHEVVLFIATARSEGIPAALVKAATQACTTDIQEFAIMSPKLDLSPRFILERINRVVHKWGKGTMKMSFFVANLDLRTGIVRYANVSHPLPVVVKNPQTGDLHETRTTEDLTVLDGSSDGYIGEKDQILVHEYKGLLQPGDVVFLYTQSMFKRYAKKDREKAKDKIKLDLVESSHEHAKSIKYHLLDNKFPDIREGKSQKEDTTFLVLKVYDRIFLQEAG